MPLSHLLAGKFSFLKEKYIGVMLPTTFAAMAVNMAAHIAGKIPVMINFSTGSEKNIALAREKCGFKTVETVTKLYEDRSDGDLFYVDEFAQALTTFMKVRYLFRGNLVSKFVACHESLEDIAVILFTSGSEKEPKAVCKNCW